MTAGQVISQTLAVVLLRSFGISIPLRGLGHVELAYLAGAYWLSK